MEGDGRRLEKVILYGFRKNKKGQIKRPDPFYSKSRNYFLGVSAGFSAGFAVSLVDLVALVALVAGLASLVAAVEGAAAGFAVSVFAGSAFLSAGLADLSWVWANIDRLNMPIRANNITFFMTFCLKVKYNDLIK